MYGPWVTKSLETEAAGWRLRYCGLLILILKILKKQHARDEKY